MTAERGAANGIFLDNTGAGGLTVTGDGVTPASGGTLQNMGGVDGGTGGIGVWLNGASNVSLKFMSLHDFSNWAIRGSNVANFTLENTTVTGTNGTTLVSDEGSIYFTGLSGAARIANSTIQGGFDDNVKVGHTGGTLNRLTSTP